MEVCNSAEQGWQISRMNEAIPNDGSRLEKALP